MVKSRIGCGAVNHREFRIPSGQLRTGRVGVLDNDVIHFRMQQSHGEVATAISSGDHHPAAQAFEGTSHSQDGSRPSAAFELIVTITGWVRRHDVDQFRPAGRVLRQQQSDGQFADFDDGVSTRHRLHIRPCGARTPPDQAPVRRLPQGQRPVRRVETARQAQGRSKR